MLKFKKHIIDTDTEYEVAVAFDVDGDGIVDIVCGPYWYKGPDFQKKIKMCDVSTVHSPLFDDIIYNDCGAVVMDVDGDGRLDVITGDWVEHNIRYRRNPGNEGPWEEIMIDDQAECVECVLAADLDNCGTPEIIANNVRQEIVFYKLVKDEQGKGTGKFTRHNLKCVPKQRDQGHGIGFVDMTGNGFLDIVTQHGWYMNPGDIMNGEWLYMPEYELGCYGSIPIIGMDISGNCYPDLVYGVGHGYGLYWLEHQRVDFDCNNWVRHTVDTAASECHWLHKADIDGDGKDEIITGKRYRAHGFKDPGAMDQMMLCYYKPENGRLVRTIIDFGDPTSHCGAGLVSFVGDVFGKGRMDIVAAGKDGLVAYENLGCE